MPKLSILIPARREEWLAQTVDNILANIEDDTEIIVGLDGEWAEPGIIDHDRVKIFYSPEPLGQRGMQNRLAKLSTAKYVAKTDAHCAFDKGFDKKLIEAMEGHDDWTIVPAMKNLHVFNWVCGNCGMEYYQGDKPEMCRSETCHFEQQRFEKKVVFLPRDMSPFMNNRGPTSTAYRFTPDNLQFKYFNALKAYQKEEIAETMSLQGSFFMATREKYWELKLADESWGGWGQQGTEVALKTWLSGGRVVCHTGTWYAHMFRTNDQLAFPWNKDLPESQGSQQRRARKICVELFKNNKWDKQTRPLSWLIERFWEPLQKEPSNTDGADRKWSQQDLDKLRQTEIRFKQKPTKGILFFTDNELPMKYARPVRKRIQDIAREKDMELVSSSRKPMDIGKNVVTREPRGYLTMFKQILKGLETMESDIVYFAEHDVLYPPEHFDFTPTNKNQFYYDHNWYKVRSDGLAVHWDASQVSGMCCYRELAIEWYRKRIETFNQNDFDRKFEPPGDDTEETWKASVPHIDIRHERNLTYNKWHLGHFRKKETAVNFESTTINNIPGWDRKELEF